MTRRGHKDVGEDLGILQVSEANIHLSLREPCQGGPESLPPVCLLILTEWALKKKTELNVAYWHGYFKRGFPDSTGADRKVSGFEMPAFWVLLPVRPMVLSGG